MKDKAIFKFNNGDGAILCSKCYRIVKLGYQFTEKEWKGMRGEIELPPYYCEQCKQQIK